MCDCYDYIGSRRDGGFAEYVAVPIWNLVFLDDNVTFEDAAMMEPLSVAVHAVKKLEVKFGDTVAIVGTGMIAFASSFPGCIRPFQIGPGQEIIAQKTAFLASTAGVTLSIFFQKRFGAGLFGGEGFIMQRLSGSGIVFLEFDGYIKEYDLAPGQQMVVDTGYLAAMTGGCQIEIQTVPGIKNAVFGGEGLFNTVITGPGRIWLQSMPVSQLAGAIRPFIPSK